MTVSLSQLRTSLYHSNLGDDSSTGKETFSQSGEIRAVLFDFLINRADDILQNPFSCKSRVNDDRRDQGTKMTYQH
jgi:hypothetical protein